MLLLVIILLSGTEAHLNPQEIVSLLEAREADDPMKHYTPEVRCVVVMTNNREYTTKEDCQSIEKRLTDIRSHAPGGAQ